MLKLKLKKTGGYVLHSAGDINPYPPYPSRHVVVDVLFVLVACKVFPFNQELDPFLQVSWLRWEVQLCEDNTDQFCVR